MLMGPIQTIRILEIMYPVTTIASHATQPHDQSTRNCGISLPGEVCHKIVGMLIKLLNLLGGGAAYPRWIAPSPCPRI